MRHKKESTLTAKEAYDLVLDLAFPGYTAETCKEYDDFFMFPYGGANVICVDKKTGEVYMSSRWQMPYDEWKFIEL